MSKRQFVQLAHKFEPTKNLIGGYFASEKLDGMRCLWDGGITRGLLKTTVPWANTAKDGRYLQDQVCTGLWSRYGHPIQAPDSWLDTLPQIILDGEVFDRRSRQRIMSVVKRQTPIESDWKGIQLHVFDSPPPHVLFADGEIRETNYKKSFFGVRSWVSEKLNKLTWMSGGDCLMFKDVYKKLKLIPKSENLEILEQVELPQEEAAARSMVEQMADRICGDGGEGVMLRAPCSAYYTERAHTLLKYKPLHDMEGEITGYTTGRETDLGSKLLGKIGALILQLDNGQRLELSGLTDEERRLCSGGEQWALVNPECELPAEFESINFVRGERVTFKYRAFTDAGIPQEARYWRKEDNGP